MTEYIKQELIVDEFHKQSKMEKIQIFKKMWVFISGG